MKNEQRTAAPSRGLPAWLDGSTIAIIVAIVGAVLSVGAMQDASESRTRSHIDTRIDDVNKRIDDVNTRFDGLEASVNRRFDEVNTRIDGLAARIDGLAHRLRLMEIAVAEIRVHLGLRAPVLPGDGKNSKKEAMPPDATFGTAREPAS